MSVIFDGTTCLGEAMVVVLQFVDSQWQMVGSPNVAGCINDR